MDEDGRADAASGIKTPGEARMFESVAVSAGGIHEKVSPATLHETRCGGAVGL